MMIELEGKKFYTCNVYRKFREFRGNPPKKTLAILGVAGYFRLRRIFLQNWDSRDSSYNFNSSLGKKEKKNYSGNKTAQYTKMVL